MGNGDDDPDQEGGSGDREHDFPAEFIEQRESHCGPQSAAHDWFMEELFISESLSGASF